ncbi:hypothetical protein [Nocardioides nanhaiensis]|uniref:hypothetical protein n=1 Tax=Nocardioides nanhaiensis TaxID=1476871 RepID=UPI0031EB8D12
MRPASVLTLILALIFVSIPIDFVELSSVPSAISNVALVVALALLPNLVARPSGQRSVLLAVSSLLALNLLSSFRIGTVVTVVPVLAAGLALSQLPKRLSVRFWVVVFFASAISNVVEWASGTHIFIGAFGVPFQDATPTEFRARGLFGAAVPAGVFTTVLAVLLLSQKGDARPSRSLKSCVVVFAGGSLAATGTRTGLLVALVCLTIAVFRLRPTTRLSPLTPFLGIGLLVAGVAVWSGLTSTRLFSVNNVQATDSFQIRSLAPDVVRLWFERCSDPVCSVTGFGYRSLLAELQVSGLTDRFSTVDNQYVSVLWDFGLVGVGALFLTLFWTLLRCFRKSSLAAVENVSLLGLLVGLFFFDGLYFRSGLLLFAFLIGACWESRRQHRDLALPERKKQQWSQSK